MKNFNELFKVNEFAGRLVAPSDYSSKGLLECLNREGLSVNSPFIDEEAFSKVTYSISPNEKFWLEMVDILPIAITGPTCLQFGDHKHVKNLSIYGLVLLFDLFKEKLPIGKKIIALDKKESLAKTPNGYAYPFLLRESEEKWVLDLALFDFDISGEDSVLVLFI